MNQDWFDMETYKKRSLNTAVWVPLRCSESLSVGKYGILGYKTDFFGCGSAMFPIEKRTEVEAIGWAELGINQNHGGSIIDGKYVSSEVYQTWQNDGLEGIHLVIDQGNKGKFKGNWYINPDLIVSLKLYREGDIWIHPEDGYVEVIRLIRSPEGHPVKIEIKAEYLKDYLCARGMGLYITWYRDRDEILDDIAHISWGENGAIQEEKNLRWEGRVLPIHEGGEIFGSSMAVFHLTRTDVDFEEDVPSIKLPVGETGVDSKNYEKAFSGRKLFRVMGEIWRDEWIEPSDKSPRVRGDKIPQTVSFVIDASGKKENGDQLKDGGRWLWFKPEVVDNLLECREGLLGWYTRNTGSLGADESGAVHFGINELGLINVYAKDICYLPEWQQRLWAGFNVGPEGGVSKELMDSQAVGKPSNTKAPEFYLGDALKSLNEIIKMKYGIEAFRPHIDIDKIVKSCQRFRAINFNGLLSLAKDIARITADSLDKKELQKVLNLPDKEKLGSLKSLEKLIAVSADENRARTIMGPLFGIYYLRLADAHLASADLTDALDLININQKDPFIVQGFTMLDSTVWSLVQIIRILSEDKTI